MEEKEEPWGPFVTVRKTISTSCSPTPRDGVMLQKGTAGS